MIERERGGGAVSVPMAVGTLAMLIVTGLGIDGVRAVEGLVRADAIAEEAARAAGQGMDTAALRRGVTAVDPVAAAAAVRAYLARAGVDGDVVVVGPDRVRVETRLTRPTVLLGLLGWTELVSTGAAETQLVAVPPEGGPP